MKKYIVLIVGLVLLAVGFFLTKPTSQKTVVEPQPVTEVQKLKLSDTWTEVADKNVDLKLEEKVNKGLTPQIVFKKSKSIDALTPAKYTDRLIAGARSTISTLRIETDKRSSVDGLYTAFLTGYYYNKNLKISLIQRVYIQGEDVSTLTASFTGDKTAEVNTAFDNIVKEKIGL
jgi:hypothetical protein